MSRNVNNSSQVSNLSSVRKAWQEHVAGLSKEDLEKLRAAGVDPDDPLELKTARFHRVVSTQEGKGGEYSKMRESYFQRITKGGQIREHIDGEEKDDPVQVFAIIITRMVIDAFDCSKSREVRFHCDCMRLALGDASMGSQKQVCEKYGVSKAMLSWNVRKIQKRLNLPKCIFNGNRTK